MRTLTGHPERAKGDHSVDVRPLDFDDPVGLVESLRGATTFYNTYWVRFPHGRIDHEAAVANSRTLFYAARHAGVERIVHVSITHPGITSPYPYFRGKAEVERVLAEVGVSYGVLRPAILFGGDGVLLNNIAWLLRRLPVFAIGGRGSYRIRPIHIDDLARLSVSLGAQRRHNGGRCRGPGTPDLRRAGPADPGHGREAAPASCNVPGAIMPALSSALGLVLRDVLLSREEYQAMAAGLADTDGEATGTIAVSHWLADHAEILGRRYANEIDRHFR